MNTILLFLAVGFLMIGIHQSMYYGIGASYWIFMIASGIVFFVQFRKKFQQEKEAKSHRAEKNVLKNTKKKK
ncbi:MAG: hypothetical protein OHK0038_06360 [Flammeovirgaceae bacterium]